MPLKSVDEHNAEKRKVRQEREEQMSRTGVACPICGDELKWHGTYCIAGVYPPPTTALAFCLKCGLSIQLEK